MTSTETDLIMPFEWLFIVRARNMSIIGKSHENISFNIWLRNWTPRPTLSACPSVRQSVWDFSQEWLVSFF